MRASQARWRVAGSGVLLLAVVASAMQSPSMPGAVVAGIVLDAATNQPLKKAWVALEAVGGTARRAGVMTVLTQADGRFAFQGVAPGQYRLQAGHTGYVTRGWGQPRGPDAVSLLRVGPDTQLTDLVLRLVPAGVISGRVSDEEGEPMPWVVVQALRPIYSLDGVRRLVVAGQTVTNDLGEYRLFGLAPGRYFVQASYRPGAELAGPKALLQLHVPEPNALAYPSAIYYPGTVDPTRAVAVEVSSGQESSGMDFTLVPSRAYRVSGQVSGVTSAAALRNGDLVALLLEREWGQAVGGSPSLQAFVLPGESFEFSAVLPGTYTLFAFLTQREQIWSARLPIVVNDGDVTGLRVILQPALTVAGRVVVEGSRSPVPEGLQVVLHADADLPMAPPQATVAPDGSFLLKNVPPGRYHVSVNGLPPEAYLEAMQLGGREVLGKPLEIESAEERLLLVVDQRGAQVAGTVRDQAQRTVAGATVILVPEGDLRNVALFYRVATADDNGMFLLRGIRPGRYRLLAWREIEPGSWFDQDLLRSVEASGVTVELSAGEQKAVDVPVLPASASGSS